MNITKVIFLDIDGVLCTAKACIALLPKETKWRAWDAAATGLLEGILNQFHDLKIVISSSWRQGCPHNLEQFQSEDNSSSLWSSLTQYDWWDHLHPDWRTESLTMFNGGKRGIEIAAWLKNHPEITQYVILDDDGDMLEDQLLNFIQTDADNGLSFEDSRLMVHHFQKHGRYEIGPTTLRKLNNIITTQVSIVEQ